VFYELIGVLLGEAALSLQSDRRGEIDDERAARERRQLTALLRRVSAIWPDLFRVFDEECSILGETLRLASEAARANGLAVAESTSGSASRDPFARYRELLLGIDELVLLFHEQGHEAWAEDALRDLRRGLADAAEAQGRLVDGMLAA